MFNWLKNYKIKIFHLGKGPSLTVTGMAVVVVGFLLSAPAFAAPAVSVDLESFTQPLQFSSTVGLLISVASISLLPFFLISTTSFVRTIIVLGFIRGAMGTQTSPPNPVLISLALFMTIFIMSPTWQQVYSGAIVPYQKNEITQEQAINNGVAPVKNFMLKYTRESDLALFMEFSGLKIQKPTMEQLPIWVVIPSFLISELKTAFQIGFLIYVPMVVIDLIVSNILLSLGMFMLSPVLVSMPFKILLFVLADGWNLIVRGILVSYQK
jgi:flagellar biosynthetic protein FliP